MVPHGRGVSCPLYGCRLHPGQCAASVTTYGGSHTTPFPWQNQIRFEKNPPTSADRCGPVRSWWCGVRSGVGGAELEAELVVRSSKVSALIVMPKLRLKTIRRSHNKQKKWDAVFIKPDGSTKTTPFGQKGYSDFTKHKNVTRRQRYLDRHRGMGENWNDPTTPGALSRWVLWNKPTLRGSIADFKKRFHL